MQPTKVDALLGWLEDAVKDQRSGEVRFSLNQGGIGQVHFDELIFN